MKKEEIQQIDSLFERLDKWLKVLEKDYDRQFSRAGWYLGIKADWELMKKRTILRLKWDKE